MLHYLIGASLLFLSLVRSQSTDFCQYWSNPLLQTQCNAHPRCEWVNSLFNRCECSIDHDADVVFVIDESAASNQNFYGQVVTFMRDIIIHELYRFDSKVAMYTFGPAATQQWTFANHVALGKDSAVSIGVQNVRNNYHGGDTNIRAGIQAALNQLNSASSSDRTRLVLVILWGNPANDAQRVCINGVPQVTVPDDVTFYFVAVQTTEQEEVDCLISAQGKYFNVPIANLDLQNVSYVGQAAELRANISNIVCPLQVDTPSPTQAGNDPVYITMDGMVTKYDGPCSYLLLTNHCDKNIDKVYPWDSEIAPPEPFFAVVAHHGRPRRRRKNVVTIDAFTVYLNEHVLSVRSNDVVVLDGEEIASSLPFHNEMISIVNRTRYMVKKDKSYSEYSVTTQMGLEFIVSKEGTGSFTVTKMPEGMMTCGLLGSKDDILLNDLKLRNGTVLNPSHQAVITVGDDWMVETENQPLICDLFPRKSFATWATCDHDRALVEEVCDVFVTRQMLNLRGREVSACFSQPEMNGMSGTRLYDDCITEMCHSCDKNTDLESCSPRESMQRLKNACVAGQVTRNYEEVEFAQVVRDVRALL